MSDKLAPTDRHRFEQDEELIYEWDQQLDEVNIYVPLPENLPSRILYCTIKTQHLELGIKGNPPYLSHDLAGPVKTDSSFWTIEDRTLHVTLQKREKGKPWPSAVAGHAPLNPLAAEEEQRRLMLERFQLEHPGFDFSQAEFTGNAPDPSKFMGGIRQ